MIENEVRVQGYKRKGFRGRNPLIELVGQAIPGAVSDDAYLKWKGQAWFGWKYRGIDTRVTGNYTDGFDELDVSSSPRKVASTVFYDFQAGYTFFPTKSSTDRRWWSDMKATVGVNNFLDTNPPHAEGEGGNSNGYPGFIYTDVGRFVYVSLEKKL